MQKAVTLIVYEKNNFKVQNDTSLTSDIFLIFSPTSSRETSKPISFLESAAKKGLYSIPHSVLDVRFQHGSNYSIIGYLTDILNKILHRELVSIAFECLKHLQCAVFNIHFAYAVKFLNFRVLASYWKLTVVKHLKKQENFKQTNYWYYRSLFPTPLFCIIEHKYVKNGVVIRIKGWKSPKDNDMQC